MSMQSVVGAVQPQAPTQQQQVQSQAQPQPQPQQKAQDVQQPHYQPIQKPEFHPIETAEGTKAISDEALKKNIENLNRLLTARQTNVTMEYDNLSSPKVVNIIDAASGNVIRAIPPESVVEIATKARDYIIGLMVDKKA